MDMYFTLVLIGLVFLVLVTTRIAADLILMAAMGCLMISGVLTVGEGLAGFANPGVMTIAILYIVAAGLQETGAVQWLSKYLLGAPKTFKDRACQTHCAQCATECFYEQYRRGGDVYPFCTRLVVNASIFRLLSYLFR